MNNLCFHGSINKTTEGDRPLHNELNHLVGLTSQYLKTREETLNLPLYPFLPNGQSTGRSVLQQSLFHVSKSLL